MGNINSDEPRIPQSEDELVQINANSFLLS